ncbi:NUDIX hydrolase [Timonella sp. A28]|uniref:NUDIX hydrolase n=1 Tax=Timonella sp. A28 TaxID=3442640 RepID=UPI003EBE1185
MPDKSFTVVAVLVQDHNDNILLVRKKNTDTYIQPGGKPELGEDTLHTAQREIHEETGLSIPLDRFSYIGSFQAPAANEPGYTIHAECVRARLHPSEHTTVQAAAEIEHITWTAPQHAARLKTAPLFSEIILPLVLDELSHA